MGQRGELAAFCVVLGVCVAGLFAETLFGGKVLSPADVLLVTAGFGDETARDYEPANRLLTDPVLQFQSWLELNRRTIRAGRLPLWNGDAGCGAPHLANGQSAVFDPFHLLAYLGSTPDAFAWIAAARLWTAGLGMFLLARAWGLGAWGRWLAGMVYPFCGFLVLWLLFPVTAVAIWMPWLLLTTEQIFRAPGFKQAGWLAVVVALVVYGGHIQTSAHVLLAAGLYALVRAFASRVDGRVTRRGLISWILATGLGLGLSAAQTLPLGYYLTKSSVWSDRQHERPAWWVLTRPRILGAVCTAAPYVYGSQRRGHPNLARALGVHNLNESAGGFAGLTSLIWLAPLAVMTRGREPRVAFLTGLVVCGAMGAFGWPPVDNLLRSLPVLDVTDNRRLTLWIAFGLSLLGGIGLDQIAQTRRLPRGLIVLWVVAAITMASLAGAIPFFKQQFAERATAHYRQVARTTPGADSTAFAHRASRQVRQVIHFLPRYYSLVACELGLLAALAAHLRRQPRSISRIQAGLISITLFELIAVDFGLNPAISREIHQYEPALISRLREGLPPGGRVLALGEELPPNVLMRFGLADVRNYDSVELASSLAWLQPLYEPAPGGRSSRSEITWRGVARARDRLRESGVCAIVAATPPPAGMFDRVERTGRVWIAWQDARPWVDSRACGTRLDVKKESGRARISVDAPEPDRLTVRESVDPGWKALVDGKTVEIQRESPVFIQIDVAAGHHELILKYDPDEVRLGLAVSVCSLVLVILVLTGNRLFWIPGITMERGLDGAKPPG